jgi:hypothetical protein
MIKQAQSDEVQSEEKEYFPSEPEWQCKFEEDWKDQAIRPGSPSDLRRHVSDSSAYVAYVPHALRDST